MSTELDNLHNDADGEEKKVKDRQEESSSEESASEQPDIQPEELGEQPQTETELGERQAEEEENQVEAELEEREAKVESETEENQQEAEEMQIEAQSLETPVEKDQEETSAKEGGEEAENENPVEEEIPFKNYESLPLEVLIDEARTLLKNHPARKLRNHMNQIRDAVRKAMDEDEAAKKQVFIDEGGEPADFYYDHPVKKEFNAVYSDFRKQLDTYYKEREQDQKQNLSDRLQIIDELKALYLEPNENSSNIFTQFRQIKTRWHNAGPIPKSHAGNVFKTYFHHLDNFYEYLNLNKELREMDYAHNLEIRESIIKRAEELVHEENVQKALNELQYLHRLWKEEAVPVAEDLREPTWQRFKDLTNKIHERKVEIEEKVKQEQEVNLQKKLEIIDEFKKLTESAENKSHGEWQSSIRKLNKLRETFFAIGRVPKEENDRVWDNFKIVTRDFNHVKNKFYKNLKSDQQQNLEKKQELLRIAKEHAESSDWNNSVQVIKRIQADWKNIGHVPRKYSDNLWKEFKAACNLFFERYKDRNQQSNKEFEQNLNKKEALLKEVKEFKLSGNTPQDLDSINDFNIRWNSLGKVPASKMSINSDFNTAVANLVKSLGLSQNEIQDFRMASLVDQIKSGQDGRLLDDEIRKARKAIDELEKEINQLETNIGFFANADENNPLLKDVYKQIEEKRNRLTDNEIRLRKLHRIDFNEETVEPESEGSSETET